ncbi:MAG: hypothetical protein KY468_06855, partial [Armatimonadetes bacterium]|nr:hypothetical protein [Armatimonadota bacterium]
MNRKLRLFLFAFIAVGAVAAAWVAVARWQVETRHRRVELVAEWRQVQQLAAQTNIPMDRLLRELRQHGVGGISVSEDTISGLRDDAALVVEADPTPDGGARTVISSYDEELLDRVRTHLLPKLNLSEPLAVTRTEDGHPALVWPGSFEQIRTINVGLPPREVKRLQDAGFEVVARIVNYKAANPSNIEWSRRNLTRLGMDKVIFGGAEV